MSCRHPVALRGSMALHNRANCGCAMKQTSLYMYSEGLTNSFVLLPSLD